jgi:hypothetical protein
MVAGVGGNLIAATVFACFALYSFSVGGDMGLRGETMLEALVVLWGSWVAGSFGVDEWMIWDVGEENVGMLRYPNAMLREYKSLRRCCGL